jgi:hypothetical protein
MGKRLERRNNSKMDIEMAEIEVNEYYRTEKGKIHKWTKRKNIY